MKGWTRIKQSTRETLSTKTATGRTEIPADLTTLLAKSETTTAFLQDTIDKSQVHFNGGTYPHPLLTKSSNTTASGKVKLKNSDDPVRGQSLYQFGQALEQTAQTYPLQEQPKQFFHTTKGVMFLLARKKAELDDVVYEQYVVPKQEIIKDNAKAASDLHEKLKHRRLDLDAQKHKLKQDSKSSDSTKTQKYEYEIQQAQMKFDETSDAIRDLLIPLTDDAAMSRDQMVQTAKVMQAMALYYQDCAKLMQELTDAVDLDAIIRNEDGTVPAKMHASTSSAISRPTTPMKPAITAMKPAMVALHGMSLQSARDDQPSAPPMAQPSFVAKRVAPPPPIVPRSKAQSFRALFEFAGEQAGDLTFSPGDLVVVEDSGMMGAQGDSWWTGKNVRTGLTGQFPSNYVQLM